MDALTIDQSPVSKLAVSLDKIQPMPPRRIYPIALITVALTTWLIWSVQSWILRLEGGVGVRTYGIAYMIPIGAMAALGGYRAGMVTLLMSIGAAVVVMEGQDNWHAFFVRNILE